MTTRYKLIGAVLFVVAAASAQGGPTDPMNHDDDPDDFMLVATWEPSGIRGLASCFHQDWRVVFPSVLAAAGDHIRGLSPAERELLRRELEDFLRANAGGDPGQVRDAWLALGAATWPADNDTVSYLTDILTLL